MQRGTHVQPVQIPFMYCWSPTVVPKPQDWGAHIDVTGYLFLNESKLRKEGYTPPQDLADFLAAGPPPVYIGAARLWESCFTGNPRSSLIGAQQCLCCMGPRTRGLLPQQPSCVADPLPLQPPLFGPCRPWADPYQITTWSRESG